MMIKGSRKVPVCSYLVYPEIGKEVNLMTEFQAMPECDASLSEDKKMIILVTESDNLEEEKELQEKLKNIKDINCLVLSFGQVQN